ncbi:Protein HEAT STRESS TOLERANT DWD 1 [Linum perenne]
MTRRINPKKAKRKNKVGLPLYPFKFLLQLIFSHSTKLIMHGSKNAPPSSSVPSMPTEVWQPGVDKLEEGEELECDITAYNSLHAFHTGWPCLSFDIVRDPRGFVRTEFPHTVYFVAGTQAGKAAWNSVGICKVSNVSGKRRDVVPKKIGDGESDMDDDSSDSDEDSDEDEAGGSKDPVLQIRRVAHSGCVNRIRAMSQSPHICATWSDSGYVQIWDVSSHLKALSESETKAAGKDPPVVNQAPLVNFKGHKDEGYALDWSPRVPGRMVSGDCRNCIHLWEPTSGTSWNVDPTPFVGHTASVEDLQWHPVKDSEFASCSVDGTIALWDTRQGKSPVIHFKEHTTVDVNVLSWSTMVHHLLAFGSDDGTFSICDLRRTVDVVGRFDYHKHPITSIEWSHYDDSTLAVSSADNQLTIWDMSVERDEEEEAEFKAETREQVNGPADLPQQLLFVHQVLVKTHSRTKGFEGDSLAFSDSRHDHVHCLRLFQYPDAFQYIDKSVSIPKHLKAMKHLSNVHLCLIGVLFYLRLTT